MTRSELLEEIRETLQRDEDISLSMKLRDIEEWDSLAFISTLSLYDQLFHINVTTGQLENCKTVNDLVELVADRLDN